MKALILGNRGFIGSHLHQKLEKENYEVIGVDNNFHSCHNLVSGIIGDIRNRQLIDELVSQVDIVYHLAAIIHVDYSIKYPQETFDVNVTGTLNVLEACKKYGKKLIFASTSEVYGTAQEQFINESHPLDCQSPYAASKVAGDRLCKSYIDTYGMDICIVRNFNTFGPYQNDSSYGGVIAIFTRLALTGQMLTIFGSGEQERDYMYIDDALQAYDVAKNLSGVYNFGTGKTVKVKELAHMIENNESKILYVEPRPGEVMRLCADITKARSVGFDPQTEFELDLQKYVRWYKENMI